VGDINVRTNIRCFNGWNRRGLGNHIGKVLGLKNGIFKIYTNGEVEDLRSVWFHGDFDQVTAIYQAGFVEGEGLNFTSVETFKNLRLWQFRLSTLCNVNFVSLGENVEIGKFIKIIKYTRCADYVSRNSYIIEEDDQTLPNQCRCGEELVCHCRMKGGNPKGYNGTSDEDSDTENEDSSDFEDDEPEEEEDYLREEEKY
jgi:hypothetical protein